jgi:hypothetical protein
MTPKVVRDVSLSEKIVLKRAKRVETAPESCRKLLVRAFSGNCSPRAAIKAFCLECVGFDREAITECSAYGCPLYEFRPFQRKGAS